uniref:Gag1-like clamp domain-containing protein n=1 Tax=Rhizophora mucronata TaxID=61149 RepID=A0A2P2LX34_RHIMU
MHGNSACLGCYMKPTLITSVERSKGLKTQGQIVKKPSIPEDLWTSSTGNMDNSAAQSQRSISSISTINQTLDPHGGPGSANNTSEFVNHGFLLWNQTRQCWVENKMSGNRPQQPREPKLNWNETYDSLLGSNKPFPQPVPLSEMVDFLVDIWEEERM